MKCLLCDSEMNTLYHQTRANYSVFSCEKCDFAGRTNIPTGNEEIKKLYGKGYLNFIKTGISPNGERLNGGLESGIAEKKNLLPRMLYALNHITGNSFFEIGFGYGEMLDEFKKSGFAVSGCELSAECFYEVVRRHENVYLDFFEELNLVPRSYSVIMAWSVIEHFRFPQEAVKKIFDLLEPGGVLIIAGANLNSWGRKVKKERWGGFSRGHFYFFSPRSIRLLLLICGFTKVKFYNLKKQNLSRASQAISIKNMLTRIYYFLKYGTSISRGHRYYLTATKPFA